MSRRPRVLVLNHFAAPPGQPGGTRHVELFSRVEGWQYLIVASDRNLLTSDQVASEPGFLTVPVARYNSNGWRRVLNWASYAWRSTIVGLRQPGVDVVYASSPHLLTGLAGLIIATVKRVPMVLEVRDLWPRVLVEMGQLSPTSWTLRALTGLEEMLYRRARIIVVMAEGTRADLTSRGVPESKTVYIPNAADPEDFTASGPRQALRKKYGFDKFTAVYAGAHGPANGLHLLLDAAAELRDLPIEIVLVGGGVSKSELMSDALNRHLSNVRFIDPIAKDEIPDLLAAADVGLHVLADVELFRSAVSPNKVFDYMASGLPVLTNVPGAVSELVSGAGCGLSVIPTGLASGIRQLFEVASIDSLDIQALGDHGRKWMAAHQSRSAMALRLKTVLSQVAKEQL